MGIKIEGVGGWINIYPISLKGLAVVNSKRKLSQVRLWPWSITESKDENQGQGRD